MTQSSIDEAMNEMVANMKNKEYVKRKLWSIPFTIGEGFVIGVNGSVLSLHSHRLELTRDVQIRAYW